MESFVQRLVDKFKPPVKEISGDEEVGKSDMTEKERMLRALEPSVPRTPEEQAEVDRLFQPLPDYSSRLKHAKEDEEARRVSIEFGRELFENEKIKAHVDNVARDNTEREREKKRKEKR